MLTNKRQVAETPMRPTLNGLESHGIHNINIAYWNLGAPQLLEHAVARREGTFGCGGAFVVHTGQFTGRSPRDKFMVRDETTASEVNWGAVNQPISETHFAHLYEKMLNYWQGHDVYVQDCLVGADPNYTLPFGWSPSLHGIAFSDVNCSFRP